MIKAVCFDLDATLMDSEKIISLSFDNVFRKMFKSGVEKELSGYDKYMGPHLEDSFALFAKDINEVNRAVREYISFYRENEFKYVKPMDGAVELLDYLKKNNYKLAIISTKRTDSAMPSINYFGLNKYFDEYICSDVLNGRFKPDPYPLILASKRLNVPLENIMMVGDNEVDMMCAKNAKVKSALVMFNP